MALSRHQQVGIQILIRANMWMHLSPVVDKQLPCEFILLIAGGSEGSRVQLSMSDCFHDEVNICFWVGLVSLTNR